MKADTFKEENEIMVQDTTNLLAPATGAVIALAKTSDPIFLKEQWEMDLV